MLLLMGIMRCRHHRLWHWVRHWHRNDWLWTGHWFRNDRLWHRIRHWHWNDRYRHWSDWRLHPARLCPVRWWCDIAHSRLAFPCSFDSLMLSLVDHHTEALLARLHCCSVWTTAWRHNLLLKLTEPLQHPTIFVLYLLINSLVAATDSSAPARWHPFMLMGNVHKH